MFNLIEYALVFFAALAAGFINTLAGGGTLVSFPILIGVGIPPVNANMTNTIALCPGYFGGIWAQRNDFIRQKNRLLSIMPVCVTGGIIGGLLLLHSDESSFQYLIPFLILIASLLLVVQVHLKNWINQRSETNGWNKTGKKSLFILFLPASVYGGYFGAGVSVIILAVLGLIYDDTLTSLNVLKQAISLIINITAALYFLLSGGIEWILVLVMCAGSITGGLGGGRLAAKISPDILRWTVVFIGITVSIAFFIIG